MTRAVDRAIDLCGKPSVPAMDTGFEFITRAADEWTPQRGIPCQAVGGLHRTESLAAGFARHMMKPIDFDELLFEVQAQAQRAGLA
jgi:DNA-binding response OmpR family regulator